MKPTFLFVFIFTLIYITAQAQDELHRHDVMPKYRELKNFYERDVDSKSHKLKIGDREMPINTYNGRQPNENQLEIIKKTLLEDFLVNDDIGVALQGNPKIAMDVSNNFVITWVDERSGHLDIYYQRYNSSGTAQGTNYKVNNDFNADHFYPAVAMDSQGNFVITWQDHRNNDWNIYYQRYNSSGTAQGINVKVNDDAAPNNRHDYPVVAMDTQGNFVIVWVDERNGNWFIYFQRYNSNGIAQGINTMVASPGYSGNLSVSIDLQGNFVIVWEDYRNNNWDLYYQRYDSSGTVQGVNTKVNDDAGTASQGYPTIAMDGGGNFVIVWMDARNGNWDIYFQRYNSSGTPQGPNSKVNDDAGNAGQVNPAICTNSQGKFLIVWEDYRYGVSNPDIIGQRYFSNGSPSGNNFPIVADGPNYLETGPVIAANSTKIVFSWEDNRRSNWDIYAKIVGWDWNGVPVELTTFGAKVSGNKVQLNWSTATEINNYGFEIERKLHSRRSPVSKWEKIGFFEGRGTTTQTSDYSFLDKNLSAGKYNYRLKQIDFDGTFKYYDLKEIVEVNFPGKFELFQNYPNPFNPSTKIGWQLPVSSWQTLKIYDVLGNEVATLVDEYKPAGSYEIEFNASSGIRNLASGIYFYQLKVGDFIETKKMLLLR